MKYLGSKMKISKFICPILQSIIDNNNINTYVEPFVGGGNIIKQINCNNRFGYDKNQVLISLLQQAQTDFSVIPENITREDWDKAKEIYKTYQGNFEEYDGDLPLWEIGAISFLGSFNNGGFSRGYANKSARDPYLEAKENLRKDTKLPKYDEIKFYSSNFKDIKIPDGSLVYCDPPYANTQTYGYSFETKFDYDEYWNWIRNISFKNYVICSEQTFPDDFTIIWEKEITRSCNASNNYKATEKLGCFKNGLLLI